MAGTPHSLLGNFYAVAATQENILDDAQETINLDAKSGGFLAVDSGDRTLPPAPPGVTVDIFAVEGLTTLRNLDGSVVATMLLGDLVTCKSVTSTTWKAISSAGAADFGATLSSFTNETDLRTVGGVPYQEDAAADNGVDIQQFFDDMGGDTSYSFTNLALDGRVYHTSEHLVVPHGKGGALLGTGSPSTELGTSEYGQTNSSTRIVKTGTNTPGEALLTVNSANYNLSGLALQGYTAVNYATIWAAGVSAYCDIGLYVPSTTVDGGTGKVHGDQLSICNFETGIKLGTAFDGEHADDFTFNYIIISTCEVGFLVNSLQVVNTHIGTFHCQGVGTGWKAPMGGNSVCDILYYGELANGITPVAAIEIGSASYSINADKHVFGLVSMDGSVNTAKILLANNTATAHIIIQCLHVPQAYDVVEPLVIAGPKVVIIESGGEFYEGMFRLIETIDGKPNVIMRAGCRMRNGESTSLLVTQGGSDGIGYLLQEGTITGYNGSGGPGDRLKQTWTNNVAS